MHAYDLINKMVVLTSADRASERKYVGRTVRVTGAISAMWVTIDLYGDNRKWLWNVKDLQVVEERLDPIEEIRREIDRGIPKKITGANHVPTSSANLPDPGIPDSTYFQLKLQDPRMEPAVENTVPKLEKRDTLREAAKNLEKAADERKLTTPPHSLEEDLREIDRKYDKEVKKIQKSSWARRGRMKRQAEDRDRVMNENKTDELLDKYIASNKAGNPEEPFREPKWFTWKRVGLVAGLVGRGSGWHSRDCCLVPPGNHLGVIPMDQPECYCCGLTEDLTQKDGITVCQSCVDYAAGCHADD